MDKKSTATEMIRRFYEAKPSSKIERNVAINSGRIGEVWWAEDGSRTSQRLSNDNVDFLRRPTSSSKPISELSGRLDSVEDLISKDIKRLESEFNRKPIKKLTDSYLYASAETIGKSEFKGLMLPGFQLDGMKPTAPPPVKSSIPDVADEGGDSELSNMSKNLDVLMVKLGGKAQNTADDKLTEEEIKKEKDEAKTLMEIPIDLFKDLSQFNAYYAHKHALEDAELTRQKLEAEKLIEEGRKKEREAVLERKAHDDWSMEELICHLEGESIQKDASSQSNDKRIYMSLEEAMTKTDKKKGEISGARGDSPVGFATRSRVYQSDVESVTSRRLNALQKQRKGRIVYLNSADNVGDTEVKSFSEKEREESSASQSSPDELLSPPLAHDRILSASQAIAVKLNSAMHTLDLRLPQAPAPPPPRVILQLPPAKPTIPIQMTADGRLDRQAPGSDSLMHNNISSTTLAVSGILDSALDVLDRQLPNATVQIQREASVPSPLVITTFDSPVTEEVSPTCPAGTTDAEDVTHETIPEREVESLPVAPPSGVSKEDFDELDKVLGVDDAPKRPPMRGILSAPFDNTLSVHRPRGDRKIDFDFETGVGFYSGGRPSCRQGTEAKPKIIQGQSKQQPRPSAPPAPIVSPGVRQPNIFAQTANYSYSKPQAQTLSQLPEPVYYTRSPQHYPQAPEQSSYAPFQPPTPVEPYYFQPYPSEPNTHILDFAAHKSRGVDYVRDAAVGLPRRPSEGSAAQILRQQLNSDPSHPPQSYYTPLPSTVPTSHAAIGDRQAFLKNMQSMRERLLQ